MAKLYPRRDPRIVRRVMRLARLGKSCRDIAKVVGISRTTVSDIGKDQGHVWGAVNVKKAAEANHAYGTERRAEQEVVGAGCLDDILKRFGEPVRVHSFNSGGYVEHTMPEPDSRALADLSRAAQSLVTTMRMLRNYEGSGGVGGLAEVQEYLLLQKGKRPS